MCVIYECRTRSRSKERPLSSATHSVSVMVDWPFRMADQAGIHDSAKFIKQYAKILKTLAEDVKQLEDISDNPVIENWMRFRDRWQGPFPLVNEFRLRQVIKEILDPAIHSVRKRTGCLLTDSYNQFFELWWDPETFPRSCYGFLPYSCSEYRHIWEPYYVARELSKQATEEDFVPIYTIYDAKLYLDGVEFVYTERRETCSHSWVPRTGRHRLVSSGSTFQT